LAKHQEQNIKEGVAIADGMVPAALRSSFMKQINAFSDKQIVDYHPYSNEIVRDIVHPALYSYVKGISPLLQSTNEVPPAFWMWWITGEGRTKPVPNINGYQPILILD
jgi:hypothetical protein